MRALTRTVDEQSRLPSNLHPNASCPPIGRNETQQQEERPNDDGGGDGGPLQLLLPDIRLDVARALLEFLYTGELRRALGLDSPLPYDLRAAAKSYGVPRLEALCAEAIVLAADPGAAAGDADGDGGGSGREWGQVVGEVGPLAVV